MILKMYITMLPLIMGGILNMVFTKTSLYKKYKYPIDSYKTWKDGKRILGDNKTIIGFFSMIVICTFNQILWGLICTLLDINHMNELYLVHNNTFGYNLLTGFLFGFTYMLFEIPNSFIKRRIDIVPGKTDKGLKGLFFFIIDQIDSLIGVFLVLKFFNHMSLEHYFNYLILGGFSHFILNSILYQLKIRRNI